MTNRTQTALNAGSISGLLLSVAFIVIYMAGYNPVGDAKSMYYWVPLPILIRSIRLLKQNEFKGQMPYWEGVKHGLFITFIYSTFFAMVMYIVCVVMDPPFVKQVSEQIVEKMAADRQNQLDTEVIQQYDAIVTLFKNNMLGVIVFSELISKLIFGGIVTLIASFVFRKSKKKQPS